MEPEQVLPQQLFPADIATTAEAAERIKRLSGNDVERFDSEWIKFLLQLAANDSIKDIVDFIENTKWTDRQKAKIIAYTRIVLGRGLSTTFLTGINDYRSALDDLELIDCEMIVGMTVFDITPEFLILIDMVKMHFKLELRRSRGADFIRRMNTSRVEMSNETQQAAQYPGSKPPIWKRFIGGAE